MKTKPCWKFGFLRSRLTASLFEHIKTVQADLTPTDQEIAPTMSLVQLDVRALTPSLHLVAAVCVIVSGLGNPHRTCNTDASFPKLAIIQTLEMLSCVSVCNSTRVSRSRWRLSTIISRSHDSNSNHFVRVSSRRRVPCGSDVKTQARLSKSLPKKAWEQRVWQTIPLQKLQLQPLSPW